MPLSGFFLKIRNFEVENEFSTFFEKCKNIFRVYRGGALEHWMAMGQFIYQHKIVA